MLKSKQKRHNKSLAALGIAVRNRRRFLELSQEALGINASMHRSYITDVEGGLRNLSFINLLRLSQALSCTLSELIANAELQKDFGS